MAIKEFRLVSILELVRGGEHGEGLKEVLKRDDDITCTITKFDINESYQEDYNRFLKYTKDEEKAKELATEELQKIKEYHKGCSFYQVTSKHDLKEKLIYSYEPNKCYIKGAWMMDK